MKRSRAFYAEVYMKKIFEKLKENRYLRLNVGFVTSAIVIATIIAAVCLNKVADHDRELMTRVVFQSVYDSIENVFDKPRYIAQTMGTGSFLREYFAKETEIPEDEFASKMATYLKSIRDDNDWAGTYIISEKTHNYYTTKGISKVIDPENDEYDIWYSTFVETGLDYDIDVNINEINNEWTIFVDKRIENDKGELMGVCAVALNMDELRQSMLEYENRYNVDISFVDEEGVTQITTDSVNVSHSFVGEKLVGGLDVIEYKDGDEYVVSKQVPRLGWYLMVENKQNIFMESATTLVLLSVGVMLGFILLIVFINTYNTSRMHHVLNKRAETDHLTQILNRAGMEWNINEFIEKKGIYKNDKTSSGATMFVIDMDHFKDVNDTLGHDIGDRALVETATILKEVFRSTDIIGRQGGDEFMVFCPGMIDEVSIKSAAKRLLDKGQRIIHDGNAHVNVSFSVGISVYPDHGETYESLYKAADMALYAVKESGRNNYMIHHAAV